MWEDFGKMGKIGKILPIFPKNEKIEKRPIFKGFFGGGKKED